MAWRCMSAQGTTQQLAAVAALHSLNWRFHSALKIWFQWPSSHRVTARVRFPQSRKYADLVAFVLVAPQR